MITSPLGFSVVKIFVLLTCKRERNVSSIILVFVIMLSVREHVKELCLSRVLTF